MFFEHCLVFAIFKPLPVGFSTVKVQWNYQHFQTEERVLRVNIHVLPQMGIFDTGLGKMGMFIQLHISRILKILFWIIDINDLKIFSYHRCGLMFGFWIACVWNVFDIFTIVNFIFCGFALEQTTFTLLSYFPWF